MASDIWCLWNNLEHILNLTPYCLLYYYLMNYSVELLCSGMRLVTEYLDIKSHLSMAQKKKPEENNFLHSHLSASNILGCLKKEKCLRCWAFKYGSISLLHFCKRSSIDVVKKKSIIWKRLPSLLLSFPESLLSLPFWFFAAIILSQTLLSWSHHCLCTKWILLSSRSNPHVQNLVVGSQLLMEKETNIWFPFHVRLVTYFNLMPKLEFYHLFTLPLSLPKEFTKCHGLILPFSREDHTTEKKVLQRSQVSSSCFTHFPLS